MKKHSMPKFYFTILLILTICIIQGLEAVFASYEVVYELKTTYIAVGEGVIDETIFSKTFILAPTINGWQRLLNYTLLVNGKTANIIVKTDDQKNKYITLDKNIKFDGKINLTLIQYIKVETGHNRKKYLPPSNDTIQPPQDPRLLSTKGFWNCNYNNIGIKDLKNLATLLSENTYTRIDYVYRVIDWVNKNTKYTLGLREGGIVCPAEFYSLKEGACGDIHAFLTTMLRVKDIPSYLYYSLIYYGGKNITYQGSDASFHAYNALPHIFSMAVLDGAEFPIDITFSSSPSGQPIDNIVYAGANSRENIIVLYKVIDANPNDYLMVYFPSNNSKVSLYISLTKTVKLEKRPETGHAILVVLSLVLLALLILFKPPSTERTYNV